MINIPLCFQCKYYDVKKKACAAFPEGFKSGICNSAAERGKECGGGIGYEEISDDQ